MTIEEQPTRTQAQHAVSTGSTLESHEHSAQQNSAQGHSAHLERRCVQA